MLRPLLKSTNAAFIFQRPSTSTTSQKSRVFFGELLGEKLEVFKVKHAWVAWYIQPFISPPVVGKGLLGGWFGVCWFERILDVFFPK